MSKLPIVCLTMLAIFGIGCGYVNSTNKKVVIKSDKNGVILERSLRDYVLTKCIVAAFKNDTLFDSDISPSIYNELTEYALAGPAGKKLDSLVSKKVKTIKPSQIADYNGRKGIFVECIDYYNSNELLQDVKKIIKETNLQLSSSL